MALNDNGDIPPPQGGTGSKPRISDDLLRVEQNGDAVGQRPPLPPRPSLLQSASTPTAQHSSATRPSLSSRPTTALSSVDIQTLTFPDGSRGTFSTPAGRAVSESLLPSLSTGQSTPSRKFSRNGSEGDDNASLMSYAPTTRPDGDLFSLLDSGLNTKSPAWRMLSAQADKPNSVETIEYEDVSLASFEREFDPLDEVDSKYAGNEGQKFPSFSDNALIQ
jgi:hypothetical protein